MAILNGHGGAVLLGTGATTIDAHVKGWTLEDTAQLHDVTFMESAATPTVVARTFFKGLETWTLTAEFYVDSAINFQTHQPGDELSSIKLDVTKDADDTPADSDRYVFTGVVESMIVTRDVDGAAKGTLRMKGTQAATLTRPS